MTKLTSSRGMIRISDWMLPPRQTALLEYGMQFTIAVNSVLIIFVQDGVPKIKM